MHSLASYIIESLPTLADCKNGWTVSLVLDFIEQSFMRSELKGYTRRQRYCEIYRTLVRLHRQGQILGAYGLGDNGREAMTYNRKD